MLLLLILHSTVHCRYMKVIDFCILTLYLITLLELLVSPRSLILLFLLYFLYRQSCHLATEHFISSFSICIPFISSSCLMALFNTMLIWSEERGHPFLVFDLSGKLLGYYPEVYF